MAGRLNFPGHSLTLIVKGTFDLKPGGVAVAAKEQPFPTGDEFYPDDKEKTGSARYESDFAFAKPRADLLLVGACHSPDGRSVLSCPVTFRVGQKSKTLAVIGDRRWEKSWLSSKLTEPLPFSRMDLRYENSFGGGKFLFNPVGKGFAEEKDDVAGKIWPLPNIEDPTNPVLSPRNRPPPAGFGPLGKMWEMRRAKLGTYKGAYLKTRWPWFPEDFDWTHFNAAPPDMQVDGFLRGDEQLCFENLHPKHAKYESKLPGLRARCFLNRLDKSRPGEPRFEEVALKLDTLWVDMEAEKLVLVWRGWAAVASEDFVEEFQDIFVMTESLSQSPASVAHCHREFLAVKSAEEKPFEAESAPEEEIVEMPGSNATAAAAEAAMKKEKDETKKKLEAQMILLNAHLGIDKLSPEHQQQAHATQTKLIERLCENDPKTSGHAAIEASRAELQQALSPLGLDLNQLPPVTEKARAEQMRLIRELGLGNGAAVADPQLLEMAALVGAVLGKGGMDAENLEPLIAETRKLKAKLELPDEKKAASETPKPIPPLDRDSVKANIEAQGSFEGADLRGVDLSGMDLQGADFAGANLAGVLLRKTKLQDSNLSGANLAGADLTEADLSRAIAAKTDFTGAKLTRAILKQSDFTGAKFANADLTQGILDEALFEDAILTGACLAGSSMVQTLFPRADLTGVNLQKSTCVKADFSKATLNLAEFQGANLTEAMMNSAVGRQINLTGAVLTKFRAGGGGDFTGAKVGEAQGNDSIWKGANLTGADFRHAKLESAIFTGACLKQANFSAANLKFARFNKADLTGAKLIRVNLFQGNLEKANLTQADLSGSNLYEAEFLDAVLDRTVTNGSNLLMTKLEAR